MNHLHLRIQIIPEIISKSNSCTKFTLQVLHKQSSDTNTLATKNLKIPLKTSPTIGKNGHRLKFLSYNSYRVLFFFQSASSAQRIVLHGARFEVEIEMRGDSVSVFRMEVTRGKEDATANYRMIIN